MAKKKGFVLTGSVQAKEDVLYLVYPHYDPVKRQTKMKRKKMRLFRDEKKSVIDRRRREMLAELEPEEARLREGYNSPENYCLIAFLNDWLERVHRYKIQESTLNGYRTKVNGKIKSFFGEKVTLDDCKPKLIHAFYDSLRAEGVSEQTVLHYHNLFHVAFEYAMRQGDTLYAAAQAAALVQDKQPPKCLFYKNYFLLRILYFKELRFI